VKVRILSVMFSVFMASSVVEAHSYDLIKLAYVFIKSELTEKQAGYFSVFEAAVNVKRQPVWKQL